MHPAQNRGANLTTLTNPEETPKKGKMRHTGLPSGIFRGKPLEELQAAADAGIGFLEFHHDFQNLRVAHIVFPEASYHAPGKRHTPQERLRLTQEAKAAGFSRIVVHPDQIDSDSREWQELAPWLLIENLDPLSPEWRSAESLRRVLDKLPEAGVCLDVAHAAKEPHLIESLIEEFSGKIRQIHLSEIDYEKSCHHLPHISEEAFRKATAWLQFFPPEIPIVVELAKTNWEDALKIARKVDLFRAQPQEVAA